MDDAGATRLTIQPPADWIAMAGGDAWVAIGNAVRQPDGATGQELARIDVPGETCLAMDGFEALWVAPAGRADRRSCASTRPPRRPSPRPPSPRVTCSSRAPWRPVRARVGRDAPPVQQLARIDPATNSVKARYGPPDGSGSVAADDAAAWVSAHDVLAVWRLPLG